MDIFGWVWKGVIALAALMWLQFCVEVVFVYIRARLRLTDWLGYVGVVAALIALPTWLWETSPYLVLGVPVVVVLGIRRSAKTVEQWREGGEPFVVGWYLFGKPPERVTNWITR